MKNKITEREKTRLELEAAKVAHGKTQAAIRDFSGSFEEKETAIKCDISDEQRRLHSFRQDLSKVLDDSAKAEEIETRIETGEKLLKRLEQRLELAGDWRKREAERLGKLEEEEQAAYTALQNAFSNYTYAWVTHVKEARQAYFAALKAYWAEAASRSGEIQFPKFAWTNLEITDLNIREFCGPIKW
jgi:chromosome segregation ATPase